MPVGSKNILDFESTGYPGDIILNYDDDLTTENSGIIKLDGSAYMRKDYKQVEKFFGSADVTPYLHAVEVCNRSTTADVYSEWLADKYEDTIAIAYLKRAASSYSSTYTQVWLSLDSGKTFKTIQSETSSSIFGDASGYARRMIRWKNKTVIAYRNKEGTGNTYLVYYVDGVTNNKSITFSASQYKEASIDLYLFDKFLFLRHADYNDETKYHFVYVNLDEDTLTRKELDVGDCDISQERNIAVLRNIGQLIVGDIKKGKLRVYEKDLTYKEYDFTLPKYSDGTAVTVYTNRMAYVNGEYVATKGYGTSDKDVARTKDFLNWEVLSVAGQTRCTRYLTEYSGDVFFYDTSASKPYSISCMSSADYKSAGKYSTPSGLVGAKGSPVCMLGDVERDESGTYINWLYTNIVDTITNMYIYKVYFRAPSEWFMTPSMSTLSATTFGSGTIKRPYIRTE